MVGDIDLKLYLNTLQYFCGNSIKDNSKIQQYLFDRKSHQRAVFKDKQYIVISD